jgi:hypothetical protein
MRAGLVGYFDLGSSAGLSDAALREDLREPLPDIGMVGLLNPLGQGTVVDLLGSQILSAWREEAVAQISRPEMELGWREEWSDISRNQFMNQLELMIRNHQVTEFRMTVYALDTVYVTFELGPGIPLRLTHGVLTCFEFAAYRSDISNALFKAAENRFVESDITKHNRLAVLTRRPGAIVSTDANGYTESTLFSSFTGLYRCIDEEDAPIRDEILDVVGMGSVEPIEFEYHGLLYYDWSACVLWPRIVPSAPLEMELLRMLECIRIAHISLGICEALLGLTRDETKAQVEQYVSKERAVRTAEDLNQLRTFALAVVNLTRMTRVTQTAEDRSYFERFAADAHLDQMQQSIVDAVEVLFNVQSAAAEASQAKRELTLNAVVTALASLTLISVSVDAYNFIREDQSLITDRLQRALILGQFVLALVLLLLIFWLISMRNRRARRWMHDS